MIVLASHVHQLHHNPSHCLDRYKNAVDRHPTAPPGQDLTAYNNVQAIIQALLHKGRQDLLLLGAELKQGLHLTAILPTANPVNRRPSPHEQMKPAENDRFTGPGLTSHHDQFPAPCGRANLVENQMQRLNQGQILDF